MRLRPPRTCIMLKGHIEEVVKAIGLPFEFAFEEETGEYRHHQYLSSSGWYEEYGYEEETFSGVKFYTVLACESFWNSKQHKVMEKFISDGIIVRWWMYWAEKGESLTSDTMRYASDMTYGLNPSCQYYFKEAINAIYERIQAEEKINNLLSLFAELQLDIEDIVSSNWEEYGTEAQIGIFGSLCSIPDNKDDLLGYVRKAYSVPIASKRLEDREEDHILDNIYFHEVKLLPLEITSQDERMVAAWITYIDDNPQGVPIAEYLIGGKRVYNYYENSQSHIRLCCYHYSFETSSDLKDFDNEEYDKSNLIAFLDELKNKSQVIWFLDIRFDPEKENTLLRGSQLRKWIPQQYRHAKGLGIKPGQKTLFYPESAINKILEMMQQDDLFVFYSDNDDDHLYQVYQLLIEQAKHRKIDIENPFLFQPGDVCKGINSGAKVLLKERVSDNPYKFDAVELDLEVDYSPDLLDFDEKHYHKRIDIKNLELIQPKALICESCKKGCPSAKWRIQAGQQLCNTCFMARNFVN